MGLSSVFQTGVSGMMASKAAVATTGHNIANANTEGFSRQRVTTETSAPGSSVSAKGYLGTGTQISRIERINDEYLEKQIRNGTKDLAHFEEKDLALKQVEDIFNEMNGDGLNRLIAKFFNEFRKLANEPESEAIRQSVREASHALVNDFHRLRNEVDEVRHHLDARIEGYTREINDCADEVKELNAQISRLEITGAPANDLLDKRDKVLKKLASYMDTAMHKDRQGNFVIDVRGAGPLVIGSTVAEKFSAIRSPDDGRGKPDGSYDIRTTASGSSGVTHQLKGGKLGALLEVRDQTLSTVLDRLDDLAMSLTTRVNEIHSLGITPSGVSGISFFRPLNQKHRAAEFIELSEDVRGSINNIATASMPNAPGDNRVAIAIAGIQDMKIMNDGKSVLDDFYNSIMSDVGVLSARTKAGLNQHRDILTQLSKIRDQVSGVSVDEETANLMQFQHTYDASAKIIQMADEMLKTVLDLKR